MSTTDLINKIVKLIDDLGWDADRMSKSGLETYDELCKLTDELCKRLSE